MSKESQEQRRDSRRVEIKELRNVKTHKDSRKERRLVLVGAGYAHLQVVRLLSASKDKVGFSNITLIDVQKYARYRGMVPGYLSGCYENYQDASIDLEQICSQPGCTFVNDGVIDVDLKNRMVHLTDDSTRISYDVLSFDIGSTTKSLDDIPGAFEYTIPTKPVQELLSRIEGIETEFRQSPNLEKHELRMVIIGGDVSAVELALSLVTRWRPFLKDRLQLTLVTADESLVTAATARIRHQCIQEKLVERGISIRFREIVKEVDQNFLKLESGLLIPFTYCIWATGAACHDLAPTLQDRGLAVSANGWIEINNSLQSVSHPNVFAAGDCCQSCSLDVPKSGVFSIQEGPVLARNLKLFNASRKTSSTAEVHSSHNLEQFHPDIHGGFQFLECGDGTGKAASRLWMAFTLTWIENEQLTNTVCSVCIHSDCLSAVAMGFTSELFIHGKWVQAIKMAMDREFVVWFDHGQQQRPGWDSSHISINDHVFAEVGSMMSPVEGAALLEFITVDNYRQAWWLLKRMALDPHYRTKVLEEYANTVEMPTPEHFGFDMAAAASSKDDQVDKRTKVKDQQLGKASPGMATAPQASCA
ncbi:unnamed protein product [Cylindrotheca closterium]|uniref:FAD/NAD(P)-binding domain-containing protein n=1 Tax=Cylindrotheca closterium TaxID=2856 RepID=A0AAD2FE97_9STRA|nr:unnamed protein product [Cylindrotheca closterium]